MVIGNCEHVANSKEIVLFFAILHCGPTDFNSMDHYVLRTTQMVIDICEHVANSKKSAPFFAILQCGQTNFNSKGHLVLQTCSKLLKLIFRV